MSEREPRMLTDEETRQIQEAVEAGRICICHAVDGNGSPILGDCPMHGPQKLNG